MGKIKNLLGNLAKNKSKIIISAATLACSASAMMIPVSAVETTPTYDVGGAISNIAPKMLAGVGEVVTACIDLAVGLVPIGLAFIGVTLLIKKGKSLIKTAV